MNIKNFIKVNGIQEADVIIVKREKFGIFDHFVVFLGYHHITYEPLFVANYGEHVDLISNRKLLDFLQTYTPTSIRRFKGNSIDRKYAIKRALNELNSPIKVGYNLIVNNCEHFANWVQKGIRESEQVENFSKGAVVAGLGLLAIGAGTEKKGLMWAGAITTLLGGIVMALESDDKE